MIEYVKNNLTNACLSMMLSWLATKSLILNVLNLILSESNPGNVH